MTGMARLQGFWRSWVITALAAAVTAGFATGAARPPGYFGAPLAGSERASGWHGVARAPLADVIPAAIACPSAAGCLAVGAVPNDGFARPGAAAARWNGSAWRDLSPAVPTGASAGTMQFGSVSCVSARRCVAAGGYMPTKSGANDLTLAELWNGASWRVLTTRNPSSDDYLGGVSCVTARFCVGVGGDRGFGGSHLTLAEVWHGRKWAVMPTPTPAGTGYGTFLRAVSCVSVSWCMAVGQYDSKQGTFTLAEMWNGQSWSIVSPQPAGQSLGAVWCVSASYCLAVGGQAVQEWNGSIWQVVTPTSPPGSVFSGVTCRSASYCLVVGGTGSAPLADTFNGSTWQQSTIASPEPGAALSAAACTSPVRCVAVGQNAAGDVSQAFGMAAYWNGHSWAVSRLGPVDGLSSVSCRVIGACIAVGGYLNPGDTQAGLAEQQHHGKWTAISPAPPSPGVNSLTTVSCAAATACMAVGGTVADHWDGHAWTTTTLPLSAQDVTCPAAAACIAVGGDQAASWNGSSWQPSAPVVPAGSNATILSSVSCAGPQWCMSVGQYFTDPHDSLGVNLAEIWDGQSWRLVTVPGAGQNNQLNSVACLSTTDCVAVGDDSNQTDVLHAFAARWNGRSWHLTRVTGANRFLVSVSCSTARRCMAAGLTAAETGDPGSPIAPIGELWNGTTWHPADPNIRQASLSSVSCTQSKACVAAGSRQDGQTLITRWNGTRWTTMPSANP